YCTTGRSGVATTTSAVRTRSPRTLTSTPQTVPIPAGSGSPRTRPARSRWRATASAAERSQRCSWWICTERGESGRSFTPGLPSGSALRVAVPQDPQRHLRLRVDAEQPVQLRRLRDHVRYPVRRDVVAPQRERVTLHGGQAVLACALHDLRVLDPMAGHHDPPRNSPPLLVGRARSIGPHLVLEQTSVKPCDRRDRLGVEVVELPRLHGKRAERVP